MEISVRDLAGISAVKAFGALNTNTAPGLQENLEGLMAGGTTKILLNLEDVDFITSAGLRVLLLLAKRLRSAGGGLRACSPNETVREVFEISGFCDLIMIAVDESEALAGF
ncbi:MAG: STAS domain-containing protein [Thermodesulfobacteriota bacterium]